MSAERRSDNCARSIGNPGRSEADEELAHGREQGAPSGEQARIGKAGVLAAQLGRLELVELGDLGYLPYALLAPPIGLRPPYGASTESSNSPNASVEA